MIVSLAGLRILAVLTCLTVLTLLTGVAFPVKERSGPRPASHRRPGLDRLTRRRPMNDLPTPDGAWRLLILDPDPADPKWMMATITGPADVRSAALGATGLDDTAVAWVRARAGADHALIRLPRAQCWRVDGRREDV
jgi:hypothetical protein